LREIQVFQLGFPEVAGEFVKNHSLGLRNTEIQSSHGSVGRPIPLSERRHLWKIPGA
jgi:hypothetical protein